MITEQLFNKLQNSPELSNVTFFRMNGPVDIFRGKPYTAKVRKLKTAYSQESLEMLNYVHGLDASEELKNMLVLQIFEEITAEISSYEGRPLIFGFYEIVEEDFPDKHRKEYMLRYDIQEEQKA